MATFVLVHSSWQGAWCWRDIVPLLLGRGHQTVVLDLPGHGADRTPPELVTLREYLNRIIASVRGLSDPPLLVGHCMGGMISLVAEECPDRVRGLIYVAGLLSRNGLSWMQTIAGLDPQYLAEIIWAPDRRTACLSPKGARDHLFHGCPQALIQDVLPLLTAEPVAPYETPIQCTPAKTADLPQYYIECLRDRLLPVALQREMYSAVPCRRVYSLDTGHAPYLQAPEELSDILDSIAREI